MSRMLNGFILPHQARWLARDDWQPVTQEVKRTIDGGVVIWEQQLHAGKPIDIAFLDGECHVTWAEKQALLGMGQTAGEQYLFEWDGYRAVVKFRFSDAPAVSFQGISTRFGEFSDAPEQSLYVGQIKLITV